MSDVEYFYPEESYYELVEKNADVLIEHTLGSYQGDMLFLLRNGDQFGFLVVGYGSCSGCDSLEACESQEAVDSLAERIYDGIKWFDSFSDLKEYVLHDNRDLEWFPYEAGWDDFVEKVNNYV